MLNKKGEILIIGTAMAALIGIVTVGSIAVSLVSGTPTPKAERNNASGWYDKDYKVVKRLR